MTSSKSLKYDPRPLMRKLCEMAGLPFDAEHPWVSKMVLVLDVDDVPRLYTVGLLGDTMPADVLPDVVLEHQNVQELDVPGIRIDKNP
jgi:hypothetical protein